MEYVVRRSLWLNAQPDVVWEVLTDPEKTKRYFFNCRVFSDWKPGSSIVWKGRILLFKKIELHGEIIDAQPEKLLKYKLFNQQDPNGSSSVVTDVLQPENGGTLLTISDDVGQGPGAEERYERSMKGWDRVLKGLKKVITDEIYR